MPVVLSFPRNTAVISLSDCGYDGGLEVVARRDRGGLDLRFLRIPPVVVATDEGAVGVAQFERGIRDGVRE